MSVKSIRAVYMIIFAVGIIFVAIGSYGTYYLVTVDLATGYLTKSDLAAPAGIILGLGMIKFSYKIFIPLKENSFTKQVACPFCGAIVEEQATSCEKCKRQLE